MQVNYSNNDGAMYLTVGVGTVAKTIEISDLISVDVDADGAPVGVEFVMQPENLTEDMYRSVTDRFPVLGRSNERARVLERVVASMRSIQGREAMSDPRDGQISVVVALPSDTVSEAADAVQALGGYGTVVVPAQHMLVPLVWNLHNDDDPLEISVDSDVHPDSCLAMLTDYMLAIDDREQGFTFRIAVGHELEAAISERGPLLQLA